LASSIESRFHKVSRDGGPIDFFRANVRRTCASIYIKPKIAGLVKLRCS
jgi:hypothetical protein